MTEHRFVLGVRGAHAVATIHEAAAPHELGLVIIVGGPQYRVGSHRLFVELARAAASSGFDTLRFDFVGMGDSQGVASPFFDVDSQISTAVGSLLALRPHLRTVGLVGLCDGATAAALYSRCDPRVRMLALINPWVRNEQTAARVKLGSYYLRRIRTADFWRKLAKGSVRLGESVGDLAIASKAAIAGATSENFIERLEDALLAFRGPILFSLSGQDFTAAEFRVWTTGSKVRTALLSAPSVTVSEHTDSNHTFSRRADKERLMNELIGFFSKSRR